jgi:hypothetical protein
MPEKSGIFLLSRDVKIEMIFYIFAKKKLRNEKSSDHRCGWRRECGSS